MAKKLVIVESPAKAKTINKILGDEFVVRASMGHVRDLPEKKLGVNIEEGFQPEYVTIKGRQKVVKELLDEAKKAEEVYLAPDPDREGEAIAWHLKHALAKAVEADKFFRVTYNEITSPAIQAAFENPSRLDMHKVDAQQARRVLDRIVGYQVSPLLWRRIRGSKSAGRVQSVALRLVCEREREIEDFKPEEYWLMGAKVRKNEDPRDPFLIKLARINGEKAELKTGPQVETLKKDLDDRCLIVSKIVDRALTRKPQPAYITSTLQQAGSSFHGFTPSRSMSIAQKLYEGMDFGEGPVGLITYMRTDSVVISKDAQSACRDFVKKTYGDDYIPSKPNVYKSRSSAQEAHEAIRPTDVTRTPDHMASVLKPDELKLYTLIWQRFVACQMSSAKIAQRSYDIEAKPGKMSGADPASYLFRVSTSEVTFPGYMKVSGVDSKKKKRKTGDDEDDEVESVPPLREGESLACLEILTDQKFTQPPPRFTEASLIRALEENGVGRPSTYAQVLSTVISRNYVDKEKRSLVPSELGMKVNDFLVSNLGELFNVGFTAQMEETLDDIELGKLEWTGMLKDFYQGFQSWIEKTKGPAADPNCILSLLDLLGKTSKWAEPVTRGKRTYSDEAFVESVREQLNEGKKAISGRQVDALVNLVAKYRDQLGDDPAGQLNALGLGEVYKTASAPKEPPRAETLRKLDLLQGVTFDAPRTVGKRIFDDAEFSSSLRQQVESGKRLTLNQLRYLDRLVLKYGEQIPNFTEIAEELGLNAEDAGPDNESGVLVELLGQVKEWNPPVQRGKREWDDKKFFDSLQKQFEEKKALSIKQRASLKKMCARYAGQIANYEAEAKKHGLPPRPKKKAVKKAKALPADDALEENDAPEDRAKKA